MWKLIQEGPIGNYKSKYSVKKHAVGMLVNKQRIRKTNILHNLFIDWTYLSGKHKQSDEEDKERD